MPYNSLNSNFKLLCLKSQFFQFIYWQQGNVFFCYLVYSQKVHCFQNSNQFQFLLNYFTTLVTCQTPCRPVCIYYLHGLYCCCFVVVLLLVVLLTTKRYRISLNSVVLSDLFLMVFVKEAWTTPKICGPICLQFIFCKCYALLSTTKSNVT